MALIDPSYFVGELFIPNTDKPEVAEELTRFINDYEDELLKKVLPKWDYEDYLESQLDEDLIVGTEYTHNGRWCRWVGLIENSLVAQALAVGGYQYKEPVQVEFDVTSGFVSGGSTVTVNAWKGYEIIIERNGAGTMVRGRDYTWNKTTGVLSLIDNIFADHEFYFVQFQLNKDPGAIVSSATKKSIIAYYVYYWYWRNNITQTTSSGESKGNHENSVSVDMSYKTSFAWNKMRHKIAELYRYLDANRKTVVSRPTFGLMNPLF